MFTKPDNVEIKYCIVREFDEYIFTLECEKKLKTGWYCVGGVSTHVDFYGTVPRSFYIQSFVREVVEDISL